MKKDIYGWTGKHIRVDLSNYKISVNENDPDIMKNYLGARGLGIKYMLDEIDPKIDAFEPQIVWLNNHDRSGLTLLQATGSHNLHIQTTIEDFLFDIL